MTLSRPAVALIAAAFGILIVSPALARRGGGVKRGKPGNPSSVQTPPDSMNNDPNAGLSSASGNDETAKDAIAMDMAQRKVEKAFESSAEWIAAQDAFHKAQDDYDIARRAAIARLKDNPDYTAACQASTKASADLDTLRKNPGASSDDLAAAASASFSAKAAVTTMEKDACTVDPAAASAKAALARATTTLASLRDKEHAAVLADPDYQAAKAKYDTARTGKPAATP